MTGKKFPRHPEPRKPQFTSKYEQALHDEIATRAFEYWQDRGCPAGSPEVDWREAERDVLARSRGSKAAAASK